MKKNNESFKESAKVYFWTFILVLILNQVLFFGACLNAVCLVAALPHVSIISFFLGRYIIRSEIENKNIGSKLDTTKAKKNEKQSLVDEEKKRLLESLELDEDLKSLKVSFHTYDL